MAQVAWSEGALADLRSVYDYIARDNRTAAAQMVLQIVLSVEGLRDFPLTGRVIPEYARHNVREIIVRRYRIAYDISGDIVEIVKVQHGARLLQLGDIEASND